MALDAGATDRVLVVRAGSHLVAVPAAHVTETMRPLAVAPLAGLPSFVLGAAVIRGLPTPVVDLAGLVGAGDPDPGPGPGPGRFVVLRVGARRVALAVTAVVGMRAMAIEALPPLFAQPAEGAALAIGRLDAELVLILTGTRLVPDDVWSAVEA